MIIISKPELNGSGATGDIWMPQTASINRCYFRANGTLDTVVGRFSHRRDTLRCPLETKTKKKKNGMRVVEKQAVYRLSQLYVSYPNRN